MSTLLQRINSATKYPSIPTYHQLGPRGILQESGNPFQDYDGHVYGTEKVDGTNGRIIMDRNGDWYIGSREELLTASGDQVWNQTLGIVDALRPLAMSLHTIGAHPGAGLWVWYLEVYGSSKLPAWKLYGDGSKAAVRCFDAAEMPADVLDMEAERIAAWRDGSGQQFGLLPSPRGGVVEPVPVVVVRHATALPATVADTYEFLLEHAAQTQVSIGEATGARPEGIVFRTPDRRIIVKARFEDYERTLGIKKGKQKS